MKHTNLLSLICCCIVAATVMTSCGKAVYEESGQTEEETATKTKKFTFTTKGDFQLVNYQSARKAPAYLSATDNTLTDLWVFDYVDGQLQQYLHQTSNDADWGQPTMNLTYNTHHIYFVASRGAEPVVDTNEHTIIFSIPRDTYWKDYEVTVVSTSNGNRAVTLDRVATKLSVTITDRLPENISTISVTPSVWYHGLDYTTGEAVEGKTQTTTITVPESKKGSEDGMTIGMFSLSSASEWTTDINIKAETATEVQLGETTITEAPFQRNRVTNFSGRLFFQSGNFQLSVDSDWNEPYIGTW